MSKTLNILIYCHRIGSRTINFIQSEIEGLNQIHNVKLLYHIDHNENPIEIEDVSHITSYDQIQIGHIKRALPFLPSFANTMQEHLENFEADVLHIHFGHSADRVLEHLPQLNLPIIISFHGKDASEKLKNDTYLNRLNKCNRRFNLHHIFVSEHMRSFAKQAGLQFNHSYILYYGTDLDYFEIDGIQEKTNPIPKFLQVSSFRQKKGHKYTLLAFKAFEKSYPNLPFELILAGGGTLLNEVQALASELEFKNTILFPGWVDKEGAKALMSNADVFVHHSIVSPDGDKEGIPNAIMEAMAMQLPILSTLHSGIPELVEDGVHGYLVEERNIEEYVNAIHNIYKWGKRSQNRKQIETKFEKKKHLQKLLSIYTKAIGNA